MSHRFSTGMKSGFRTRNGSDCISLYGIHDCTRLMGIALSPINTSRGLVIKLKDDNGFPLICSPI